MLLKNSIAVTRLSVAEKVDPLERDPVDGLRPPKLLVEKREASFSTE
jgi:hypothetical protein